MKPVEGSDKKPYSLYYAPDGKTFWSPVLTGVNNLSPNTVKPVNGIIQQSPATEACKKFGELIGKSMRLPTVADYENSFIAQFDHLQNDDLKIDGITQGLYLSETGLAAMKKTFSESAEAWYWTSTVKPNDTMNAFDFNGARGFINHAIRVYIGAVRCIGN